MRTQNKKGGRRVELFLPFSIDGKRIVAIEFAPISWGHTLDWQAGKYKRSFDLMMELTGVSDAVLRGMKYPDVDRVVLTFMEHLPPEIRDDITAGHIPLPFSEAKPEAPAMDIPAPDQSEQQELDPAPPGLEHPADADISANFKVEDWAHIKPDAEARLKDDKAKSPTHPESDGLGFALNE
jgi:hypothetical protein